MKDYFGKDIKIKDKVEVLIPLIFSGLVKPTKKFKDGFCTNRIPEISGMIFYVIDKKTIITPIPIDIICFNEDCANRNECRKEQEHNLLKIFRENALYYIESCNVRKVNY